MSRARLVGGRGGRRPEIRDVHNGQAGGRVSSEAFSLERVPVGSPHCRGVVVADTAEREDVVGVEHYPCYRAAACLDLNDRR
jgi:hypothetical protein